MIFILLALLNLLLILLATLPAITTAQSETFIKVTRFQVPNSVRLGDSARLSCAYELGGQSLHAMKLFKDDKEFFRYTPNAASREEQRLEFPVPGINLDRRRSSEREVWLRNVSKASAGVYKCQVSVEETFNSISAERRMEVLNRTLGPGTGTGVDLPMFGLAGTGGSSGGVGGGKVTVGQHSNRQPQQRHTVQQQQSLAMGSQQRVGGGGGKTAYGLIPAQPGSGGGQYQYQAVSTAGSSSSAATSATFLTRKSVNNLWPRLDHLLQALPTIVHTLSIAALISWPLHLGIVT